MPIINSIIIIIIILLIIQKFKQKLDFYFLFGLFKHRRQHFDILLIYSKCNILNGHIDWLLKKSGFPLFPQSMKWYI